jgi:hypothetical protein
LICACGIAGLQGGSRRERCSFAGLESITGIAGAPLRDVPPGQAGGEIRRHIDLMSSPMQAFIVGT